MVIAKPKVAVILFILAIGIFYCLNVSKGHDWGGDFSLYIAHAKNIVEGIDYSNTGYLYNPLNPIAPEAFPPIFPLLLAPVYALFGLNLLAMKIEIVFFFILSLFIIYLFAKRDLSFRYSLAIVALVGLSPLFFSFKNKILSDIPFLFFLYLSLLLIGEIYDNFSHKSNNLYALLAGLLIYFTYGIRSIGLVILPALFVYELIIFKKISKFFIKVSAVFLFFAAAQNIFINNSSFYFRLFFLRSPAIFLDNSTAYLGMYIKSLSLFWANGYSDIFRIVLFIFISGLGLTGFFMKVRKKIDLPDIFFIFYFFLIVIFGGYQERYLIPIIPLYLFYVFWTISEQNFLKNKKVAGIVFYILISVIFASYTGVYIKNGFVPVKEGITKKESVELFNFISAKTKKTDVFIFQKPGVLALLTGRRAAVYNISENDKEVWDYFKKIKADYIIAGRIFYADSRFLFPFTERYKDKLEMVYSNKDFKMFKIKSNNL